MLCAGIFTCCHDIVQYHLGGTKDKGLALSPARLMFDTVRLWATDLGYKTFHLGGGVGGHKDSLYQFKKGFSKTEHSFYLWKWVIDSQSYDHLCQTKNLDPTASDFFPAYRSPTPIKTPIENDLVVSSAFRS